MKLSTMFAAVGLTVAALGVSVPAQAHSWPDRDDRYYGYPDRSDRYDRRDERRWEKHWKKRHWREQRRYGWNDGRRCWREWRHGERVRVCSFY